MRRSCGMGLLANEEPWLAVLVFGQAEHEKHAVAVCARAASRNWRPTRPLPGKDPEQQGEGQRQRGDDAPIAEFFDRVVVVIFKTHVSPLGQGTPAKTSVSFGRPSGFT